MNEITVMLPAYNEEKDLEQLAHNWQQYTSVLKSNFDLDLKIIVVNDGSQDNTEKIARTLEKQYANFKLINHEKNKGLGEAVKTGLTYIVNSCPNSRFACLMDCDNTHDPKYVLDMLKKEKETGADIVIASRYQKGAEVKGVSSIRLLTSEGARYIYSGILHVKNVRDYTCGYRLYNTKKLAKAFKRYGSNLIAESGFTCMAELLYKLYTCGAKFAEIPFELRYDFKQGASKMKVIKTAVNSVALAFRLRGLRVSRR